MNTHAIEPADRQPAGNIRAGYGVAELRATYAATLLKSLAITTATVAAAAAIVLLARERKLMPLSEIAGQDDSVYVIPYFPVEPAEPQKHEDNIRTTRATLSEESMSTEIRDSVAAETNFTTTSAPADSASTARSEGSTGTGAVDAGSAGDAQGNGSAEGTGTVMNDYEVTEMPEFEGGLKELYRFLRSQTHYPEHALRDGREAMVHVRFVVSQDGTVTDVSLLHSAGKEFDDEALRVVKLLPRFSKPARVNGKPVKVYYRVPFTFRCR